MRTTITILIILGGLAFGQTVPIPGKAVILNTPLTLRQQIAVLQAQNKAIQEAFTNHIARSNAIEKSLQDRNAELASQNTEVAHRFNTLVDNYNDLLDRSKQTDAAYEQLSNAVAEYLKAVNTPVPQQSAWRTMLRGAVNGMAQYQPPAPPQQINCSAQTYNNGQFGSATYANCR